MLAGLLARALLVTFPFQPEQWLKYQQLNSAYSYGDSAGITPDFPFNPEPSGTNYGANVMGYR